MTCVVVRFSVSGKHCWPNANDPVFFLKFPHRHKFFFEAKAQVTDLNREIEFITLQSQLIAHLTKTYKTDKLNEIDFEHRSCEMIGDELLSSFPCLTEISVFEDNENGAIVTR